MNKVRVRVRVLLNAEGKWAAYGWTDATDDDCDSVLYDMMGAEDTLSARAYYLTAEIEIPRPVEVAAQVEGEDG
jgi:hypothetical protein